MSCPVLWPTERFFDPIGNTSAVSLTRDLPPEVDADILLLNCNDCRNVLFTVFCEHANSHRKLDFTCSDVDLPILARAVILLTMVMDGTPNDIVWNFFYHTSLDEASFATLMTHCRKLAALTESLGDWDGSVYSTVVKFGSTLTLSEVHRLLSLYADSDRVTAPKPADHPAESGTDSAESVEDAAAKIIDYYSHSSARSAGPMHKSAERVFQEHFKLYCKTGTTFTDERDQQASASHHNPTFHYSRHGSDSVVHPCTEPLAPFHTAPVFGDNDSDRVSVADVVDAARREFSLWCRTFRIAAAKTEHLLVVRFLFGDPLAVAHTFEYFNRWKMLTSPMFVAPWSAKVLELSAAEYERDQAPGIFNVIDTSTLWDTVGMYNILPSATPILSTSPQSYSVLYTESFVRWYDNPKTGLAGYRFEHEKQYTPPGLKLWRLPKDSITAALYRSFATSGPRNKFGKPYRIVRLCETSALKHPLGPSDTILFMSGLRYDLTGHTVVADAYVLTVASPLTRSILAPLMKKDALGPVPLFGEELRMWKQLLPAVAERCRSWSHGPNCEYKATGRIPLETQLHGGDPLCSCGRGKDVEGLLRVKAWAPFAPHVTRIALSPLFPVTYLEPLMMKFLRRAGGMTADWKLKEMKQMPPNCRVCGRAKYDLKKCARCQKDTYCSEKCQRENWPRHKKNCKGLIKQ